MDDLSGVVKLVSDGSVAAAALLVLWWFIRTQRASDKEQNAVQMAVLEFAAGLKEQNALTRQSLTHQMTEHDRAVQERLAAVLVELAAVRADVAASAAPIAERLDNIADKLEQLLERGREPAELK